MKSSNKLYLLTLSTIALILVSKSHITKQSSEEMKELEKQLNHINKPAIKSFQTEHGYILDCIDIQKQLAFDHPLLKNHSIQLKPTTIPKWIIHNNNSQNSSSLPYQQDDINCPIGTIIVKRVTIEDLIQAQRLKSLRQFSSNNKNMYLRDHFFATVWYEDNNHGAKGNINIWSPKVSQNQFSLASITVIGDLKGLQSISAGWIVHPEFNMNHSSVFTYWTADDSDQTGCFNLQCPGFIHVSTKFAVGVLAQPVSIYGGQQYHLEVSIYQDHLTGHWWFVLRDEPIGYWPRSLFKADGLANGATSVNWGGENFCSVRQRSPTMGSGHFPQEGYKKAAYVNDIQVMIDTKSRQALIPTASSLKIDESYPSCYKVDKIIDVGEWSRAIFFGGPEGCKI
ncbi:uncharacterized protein LOC17885811 [Capsella rubella]|uniref:uncharacterized protein LOC17885811 n=1 Tax=Capsella rubella TaxID=81985 RepID=UPI000CD5B8A5|nr:uncharacterized protein LOC17885811 [Capsella rubella]